MQGLWKESAGNVRLTSDTIGRAENGMDMPTGSHGYVNQRFRGIALFLNLSYSCSNLKSEPIMASDARFTWVETNMK